MRRSLMKEPQPHKYQLHLESNQDSEQPDDWDHFVAHSPWGHILQSYRWGQFKEQFGWRAHRLTLVEQGAIVGGIQVLMRPLPMGRTLAYVPRGPVVAPGHDDALRQILDCAIALARRHRAIFLKVEPAWGVAEDPPALWKALRMQPGETVQPRNTIMVDLTGSEETWLGRMKSKTRYNIRLAGRKGIEVREGDEDDLLIFHELMAVTGQRDHFAVRDLAYYRKAWEAFAPAGLATLLLATFEGEVLAGLMPFAFGKTAWYMYGASSNRHRNKMPNHALQWAAMRWAKSRGCTVYDLWGIPDEVPADPNKDVDLPGSSKGSLWGVYRFKKGFGGRQFRSAGGYDAVLSPSLYWAYRQVQKWRHRRT